MKKQEEKTGRLERKGYGKVSWVWYEILECVDCKTQYTRLPGSLLTVNGHTTGRCPWCRPDSAPWKYGRGR